MQVEGEFNTNDGCMHTGIVFAKLLHVEAKGEVLNINNSCDGCKGEKFYELRTAVLLPPAKKRLLMHKSELYIEVYIVHLMDVSLSTRS